VTFDPLPDQFLRLYSYRPLLSEAEKMEILGQMGVDTVVIMPFGKDRAGNAEILEEFGRTMGFKVHAVPLVRAGGEKISASQIRELIESGRKLP